MTSQGGVSWRRWRAGALALALVACSSKGTETPDPSDAGGPPRMAVPKGSWLDFPVEGEGPYNVGHRTVEITYTPPGGAPPRTIPIELWYPTLDTEGETSTYGGLLKDATSFEGASTAAPLDGKAFPVHVYSHGSSGFAGTAWRTSRTFASHGWVVAAPNHVGNLLRDGTGKRPLAISYLRSTDVSATLDALEKLPSEDALAGKLRTSRVLLSGHSFGAFTALASVGVTFDAKVLEARCASGEFSVPCKPEEIAVFTKGLGDPRVAAAVPMAGTPSDSVSDYGAAKAPVMLMSGTLDVSSGPIFERANGVDVTWLELTGGCHEVFALGGCKELDETRGYRIVATYLLAFGRRLVLGDASENTQSIVTGQKPVDAVVRYHHKGPTSPPGGP